MSSDITLTRKQQEIYEFLVNHENSFSHPPSLDELCRAMGLKSRGSLHKHIQALTDAGLVEPANRKQRGIRLRARDLPDAGPELPLVGYIAAGRPIEAVENPEFIGVPDRLKTTNPCFVLQVKGDSMIDDGILDGDWVVIERRNHARNGEIVVALIEHSEATLKRIEQRPGEILLIPSNTDMAPMHYKPEQVEIQGVVVGQMRSYHDSR